MCNTKEKFIISHIKKAIWNLECANKLQSDTINIALINELKLKLIELKNEREKVSEN